MPGSNSKDTVRVHASPCGLHTIVAVNTREKHVVSYLPVKLLKLHRLFACQALPNACSLLLLKGHQCMMVITSIQAASIGSL